MWKAKFLKWAYSLSVYLPDSFKQFSKQLLFRILISNKYMLIKINGMPFYIHPTSASIDEYVLQPFEPYTTELFKEAIKPGAVVLDIGAQFGYYSLLASKMVGQKGRVFAFEPVPSNFEVFRLACKPLLHERRFKETMRVCFISHSSGKKGGAERALLELIDALKERDVECYVILPGHGPLIEELRNRRIDYWVCHYRWWMGKKSSIWKRLVSTFLNLAMVVPIAARIKRWKCDIVYTNTITVCVGAIAAKLLGLPHVWHIHEFGYEDHGLVFDLGSKFSLWLMDRLSTTCIANSHAVARKYQQYIKPSKLNVVYYSVNVPGDIIWINPPFTPGSVITCVIVGQLQEGKRQEDAIWAVNKLVGDGISIKLYIVGDGDPNYRKYLYRLVTENSLVNNVHFTGWAKNPFTLMQKANVALMCSRCEAFGRVTVEAMKLGKPVIGTRSGGTTELVQDGFNGLLYTPGDYKELASKIKYLYENPDILQRMGKNAQQWAKERFTQERYGNEVMFVLKQIVKDKSKKSAMETQ